MPFSLTLVALCSMAVGLGLFWLYRKIVGGRMNQAFREDGPSHHLKKGRVPTGAGLVFVIGMLGISLLLVSGGADQPMIWVCLAAALMGLLGFVDDRAKVLGGSAGLKARFKFPAMLLVGALLLFHIRPDIAAGLTQIMDGTITGVSFVLDLPNWLYYALGLFIWLGAINGSNFTDGLDGLLGTTTLASLLSMLFIFSTMKLLPDTDILAAAVIIGLLIAFLNFNWKPASIYIGDSGSLCIGAFVAGLALLSGLWLYLGLFAFIWVVEVLSVMLQVVYFKRTGGKRIFLMTPIHHHFELAGWKETTVVYVFAALQAWGCLSAWLWLMVGPIAGIASSVLLVMSFIFLVLRYRTRVA